MPKRRKVVGVTVYVQSYDQNGNLVGRPVPSHWDMSDYNNIPENQRVGGSEEGAIPEATLRELLKSFPNTYELNKYASARISGVLSSYIETKDDYEEKYKKYLNKRVTREGTNLSYLFSEVELLKYRRILEKHQ